MISVSLQEDADVTRVGGKAANLMKLKNFNISAGICITTEIYELFCEKNELKDKISDMVILIDYDDMKSIEEGIILNIDADTWMKTVGLQKVEQPVQPHTIEGPTGPLD